MPLIIFLATLLVATQAKAIPPPPCNTTKEQALEFYEQCSMDDPPSWPSDETLLETSSWGVTDDDIPKLCALAELKYLVLLQRVHSGKLLLHPT